MDQGDYRDAGSSQTAQRRTDIVTMLYVELGIAIQAALGTYEAADYLQSKGIARHIAERVLVHPLCRRNWPNWNDPI